ncbi:DUF2283 domain-containing protein [Methylobacterium iners]|uniref:DUF2283 domain-containing protein n=1 Tax=Methylobacterium iners TaxID=418707 RepID=A0ABQ4RW42_9HYPH|nr:DUF2283 domain-containing protein [Methylobacterium iners]GJD94600.1 hypothetical protein OCOJLMKI_1803 [Methylobacterium iners]
MKARYDSDADALYMRLADDSVVEREEVRPGIVLDFDAEGRVIAIEILDASQHLARVSDFVRSTAA